MTCFLFQSNLLKRMKEFINNMNLKSLSSTSSQNSLLSAVDSRTILLSNQFTEFDTKLTNLVEEVKHLRVQGSNCQPELPCVFTNQILIKYRASDPPCRLLLSPGPKSSFIDEPLVNLIFSLLSDINPNQGIYFLPKVIKIHKDGANAVEAEPESFEIDKKATFICGIVKYSRVFLYLIGNLTNAGTWNVALIGNSTHNSLSSAYKYVKNYISRLINVEMPSLSLSIIGPHEVNCHNWREDDKSEWPDNQQRPSYGGIPVTSFIPPSFDVTQQKESWHQILHVVSVVKTVISHHQKNKSDAELLPDANALTSFDEESLCPMFSKIYFYPLVVSDCKEKDIVSLVLELMVDLVDKGSIKVGSDESHLRSSVSESVTYKDKAIAELRNIQKKICDDGMSFVV